MRNRRKAEEKVHMKNAEIGVVGATSQRLPSPSQKLTERKISPLVPEMV